MTMCALTPPLRLQASEVLLFNKKLTAVEASDLGLVTEVFPDASFQAEVWPRLKNYGKLPPKVSKHTRCHFLLTADTRS